LLPKSVQKVHPRFQTPYIAIIIEGAIALVLSLFTGITQLISFAVFNLAVCYLLVCLALSVLKKSGEHALRGQSVLPWMGVLISLYLIYSTSIIDKLVGSIAVLSGIPIYVYFSKTHAGVPKATFLSEEDTIRLNLEKQNRFLANLTRLIRRALDRLRRASI
jgi:APA family basic amino acid/polyamine antiporter